MFFYEVLFNLAINNGFIYHSDIELEVGRRVVVDFKSKEKIGVVWRKAKKPDFETKPIINILDDFAVVDQELYETIDFFSFYYMTKKGLMLKSALPAYLFYSKESCKLNRHDFKVKITPPNFELSRYQKEAIEGIKLGSFNVNLLFGVTGSGKTQVYLALIEKVLGEGKKAVVLVPEIALTPQYIDIFNNRFGDGVVALIHSRLTRKQKFENWLDFVSNKKPVLIGTRSAAFVPLNGVGIIVIDEENDESYKQENQPFYNAKDVLIYRANKHKIPVVLSSATPTCESYFKAKNGKFNLFRLLERVGSKHLPTVEFVKLNGAELFYDYTIKAIAETINSNRAVAVLINRRGFSKYLVCKSCGYIFRCPNCSVSLRYHKEDQKLKCHWCESIYDLPEKCPKCGSIEIAAKGYGTQRVFEYLQNIFKDARLQRFDRDSTSRKGSFEKILTDLRNGKIDILIGTQMLSKGHDISRIGLVVIANYESLFMVEDFRAFERAVSLVIQTAGRSGRLEDGRVIIQTQLDEPPFYEIVKKHDYEAFLNQEIESRKLFRYPPFSRIIRIVARSTDSSKARKLADSIKENLSGLDFLGPAKCPIFKLRNFYRYHIIIKSSNILKDIEYLSKNITLKDGIYFDIDPVSFF
ncbi:replication restart helicase PriA [Hippea jasoniae]|uniref:replication restart helicase PriA n=1 Tax=Hippea jasoniae TaxID=944479 RepID=UPI00068AAE79|nr:primosomal protein N' [Hippea jasoniae]